MLEEFNFQIAIENLFYQAWNYTRIGSGQGHSYN